MKVLYSMAALLCLGSVLPASAQAPVAVSSSLPAMTHADSVAFLHQVFLRARRSNRVFTLLEGLVLPALAESAFARSSDRNPSTFSRVYMGVSTGVVSYGFVASAVKWSRFSRRRERAVLERFEQRQSLPRYVNRQCAMQLAMQQRWPQLSNWQP